MSNCFNCKTDQHLTSKLAKDGIYVQLMLKCKKCNQHAEIIVKSIDEYATNYQIYDDLLLKSWVDQQEYKKITDYDPFTE